MKKEYAQLSIGGFASKLLGGLREILLARYFGTGQVADAYRASLSLTLSPAHLVTSRVVQTCFIPLYARYAEADGEKEKGAALFQSLLVFLALGLILGVVLALRAPARAHPAGLRPIERRSPCACSESWRSASRSRLQLGARGLVPPGDFVIPALRPASRTSGC
jgi:hypothetical protein